MIQPNRRLLLQLLTAMSFLMSLATATGVIAAKEAWEYWKPAATLRQQDIDHDPWARILDRYLVTDHSSGIHRFDYAAVNGADRESLDGYIDDLAGLTVAQLTRTQQQAFWINLYNALTVRLILDNPGVDSIRDIRSGLFSIGPWGREIVEIDGRMLTLDDIEHRILRPIYGDPRVHFAVNCASLGCPNLQPEPWRAETLDEQYDRAAREFINHPRGVTVADGRLTLSSIFKWFDEDFGADREAVLAWIAQYAEPPLADTLRGWDDRVRYEYDWALNAP